MSETHPRVTIHTKYSDDEVTVKLVWPDQFDSGRHDPIPADGTYGLHPVGSLVIAPCEKCGGTQKRPSHQKGGLSTRDLVPCPDCTLGFRLNSSMDTMKWCYVHQVRVNPADNRCNDIESCLVHSVLLVDLDAVAALGRDQKDIPQHTHTVVHDANCTKHAPCYTEYCHCDYCDCKCSECGEVPQRPWLGR